MQKVVLLFLIISFGGILEANQDACRKKGITACTDAFIKDASCFPVMKNNCFKCKDNKTPNNWRRAERKREKAYGNYKFMVFDGIGLLSQIDGNTETFYYNSVNTLEHNETSVEFFYQQAKIRSFDSPLAIEDAAELKANTFHPTNSREHLDNVPVVDSYLRYTNLPHGDSALSSELFCYALEGFTSYDPKYEDGSGNLSEKAASFNMNWPKDKNGRLQGYEERYGLGGFSVHCGSHTNDRYKNSPSDNVYAFCISNPTKCDTKKAALTQYYNEYLNYLETNHPTPCLCSEGLGHDTSKQCMDEIRKKNQEGLITCYIENSNNTKRESITVDDFIKFKNTGEDIGVESAKKWWSSLPDSIHKYINEDRYYGIYKYLQATAYVDDEAHRAQKKSSNVFVDGNVSEFCVAPKPVTGDAMLSSVDQFKKRMLGIFDLK